MNDKDNKYIFDDEENDDLEIAEYLERELNNMDAREKNRIRNHGKRTRLNRVSEDIEDSEVDNEKQSEKRQLRLKTSSEANKKSKEKKAGTRNIKKPKFLLYYDNNKLKVLWCTFGVLVVILLAALIVTNVRKSSDDDDSSKEIKKTAEVQNTEETTDEAATNDQADENAFLAEPADSPYNQVCEAFLRNTYVQWNDEALLQICDNTQNLQKDYYTFYNKYIDDIENVNCYVGYETEDGKLLILVTYNMKFVNISTSAPDMIAVVLVKTQDGEGYLIHNLEVEDEMNFYTSGIQNNQNYLDLCSNVRTQLDVALDSDEDLKKVYDIIKGMGTQ